MLYRTVLMATVAGTLILGTILVLLVAMSWRSLQRLEPVNQHLAFYTDLEAINRALSERFVPEVRLKAPDSAVLDKLAGEIERTANSGAYLAGETPALLSQAARELRIQPVDGSGAGGEAAKARLADAMHALHRALGMEVAAQKVLLRRLDVDNRQELQAALVLAVAVPLAAAAFLVLFRRRVLAPLNDLSYLMGLLARRDYNAALTDRIAPLMRPLFDKYNRMAERMHDMEQDHLDREDSLQRDVNSATRALIQQQLALSRAERLAAAGDLAARMAHELRNPLSGVLMAMTNLQEEIASDEQAERLRLAIEELERIARLLTRLVDEARQAPERPRRLRLAAVVQELLTLVHYQLPDNVRLDDEVPGDLHCRLPEAGLRHALINLILNAAQAIGGVPGHIRVRARKDERGTAISVYDDGPGLPPALLESGMHDFGSWRPGGTGLGLTAVRRFANHQGGRLELRNLPQQGACATLIFPPEEANG